MADTKASVVVELKDNFSKAFGDLGKNFKESSKKGEDLKKVLDKNTNSFKKQGDELKDFNKGIKSSNEELKGFITTIGAFFASSIGFAKNNVLVAANRKESSIALSSILGKDSAKNVESGHINSQKQGLGTYEDIASTTQSLAVAGVDAKDLNKSTEAILKFSKVAKMELGASLEMLAPVAQYTNRSIEDLTDIIANAQTKFKINKLDDFSSSLKNIGYSGKQANLSAEDMVSTLGYFSTKMTTGEAEGGLKEILNRAPQVIKELNLKDVFKTDGSLDFVKFLTQIEQKTKSLSKDELEGVFSKEGLWIIKEAAKNSKDLSSAIDDVTKSYKGQLDVKYADHAGSYNTASIKLQQSLANLSAILGDILLPKFTDATNAAAKIVFAFNDFIQANEWAGKAILYVSGVLGILMGAFAVYRIVAFASYILGLSKVFTILRVAITAVSIGMRILTGVMMSNPILAIISAIAIGAYLIISNWETVKEWFASFFEWFENSAVFKFFKTGIDKIKGIFSGDNEIKVDSSSTESIKQNSPVLGGNNSSKIENKQQYNITVNSHSSNPSDVGGEVMRELEKSMVGN